MRIDVKQFYPATQGIMKQREAYYITFDLIVENGFRCIVQYDNLKECIFVYEDKQYKFNRMEYWTFNKHGEIGLDIDYISMDCITTEV